MERSWIQIPAGAAGIFFFFSVHFQSLSVSPTYYQSSTQKISVILPKVQVSGYSKTHMYPTPVASNSDTKLVHGCMIYTEASQRRHQRHTALAM